MQREADSFISNIEKQCILQALKDDLRIDGRKPYDFRKVNFQFSLDDSSATVTIGSTRVMAVVSAVLEAPFPDRPNEGQIRFNVEFSPMASPAFEAGRPTIDAIEVARLVERGLKQSHAVDAEALCVMAGRKVWSLRVDVHVLDHEGNILDASMLAALAALMVYRKPEVTVGGDSGTEIIVHPPEVREPTPLTIHHFPVCVTFGLFESANLIVVDPSLKEEATMQGSVNIMMNPQQEVCAIQKADGCGMTQAQLMRCIRIASQKVEELVKTLREALDQHDVARVQARVRRHRQLVGLPQDGRNVVILGSDDQPQTKTSKPTADVDMEEATSSSESEESEEGEEGEETSSEEEEDEEGDVKMGAKLTGEAQAEVQMKGTLQRAGPKLKAMGQLPTAPKPVSVKTPKPSQKKVQEVQYDELEAIAAVIAGANTPQQEQVTDLTQAVKVKGTKRKA